HCRFEAIRVADDPVGHEAAVAAAGDAQPVAVYPRILRQNHVDAAHDVCVIFATPLAHDAILDLLAVAGRAARVGEEDRPAARRVYLELLIPVDAILPCGAAVNAEDHRILLAFLPAERLHEKAVNPPAVG